MNLVMRGVATQNIKARNADTLEDDWPINPIEGYGPLYVDAVVSNPPYSQKWDPSHKDGDPRYSSYGMAPKSKADYAFLLHDLYHMKPDGIMSIVLPHGVLFRGGEERTIRKNLIEKNKIDAIIGLPANIFFGTPIPTIIMILKQNRENDDILIVDASKGFEKVGKKNKLRASDIRKIIDTVVNREEIEKYSTVVSKAKIRKNDYNLNIPRYVDSSEEPEHWDIYALMYGGIPKQELHEFEEYWEAFPKLREELFIEDDSPYVSTTNENLKKIIYQNKSVQKYLEDYESSMKILKKELEDVLLEYPDDIAHSEEVITKKIFEVLKDTPIVDKYKAYQELANHWSVIAGDLETIKLEGIEAANKVNPNMVTKKVKGKMAIVQDGYVSHILPFDLVQKNVLQEDFEIITNLENNLISISDELTSIIDTLTEEEKSLSILNDANDAFVVIEVNRFLQEASAELTSPEIEVLNHYIELLESKASVNTQKTYIEEHKEVKWQEIKPNAKGLYNKKEVKNYIKILKSLLSFESETLEDKIKKVSILLLEEKELNSKIKELTSAFYLKTKETIEGLNELQIKSLLNEKWITPVLEGISELAHQSLNLLVDGINQISKKYEITYSQVSKEIEETEEELCKLINQLDASEYDLKGLNEFQSFLKGDLHE
jgi:type I restriction-modification system protein